MLHSFKIISKPFLPKATQMLQMISFGIIFINFGHGFEPKAAHDLDFERTLHSKWLSTRNGFGITPKGPMSPKGPMGTKSPIGPKGSMSPNELKRAP